MRGVLEVVLVHPHGRVEEQVTVLKFRKGIVIPHGAALKSSGWQFNWLKFWLEKPLEFWLDFWLEFPLDSTEEKGPF